MVSVMELAQVLVRERAMVMDQAVAVTSVVATSTPAVVDQAVAVVETIPRSSLAKT